MYQNIIAWAGLGLLFILCLPITGLQRLILAVYGWAIRLALLGLIGGAAYLWFYPGQTPAPVTEIVRVSPELRRALPEPGIPIFGVCAAGLAALILLPLLAVIDIARKWVGRQVEVVREVRTTTAVPVYASAPVPTGMPPPAPLPNRFSRRSVESESGSPGREPVRQQ